MSLEGRLCARVRWASDRLPSSFSSSPMPLIRLLKHMPANRDWSDRGVALWHVRTEDVLRMLELQERESEEQIALPSAEVRFYDPDESFRYEPGATREEQNWVMRGSVMVSADDTDFECEAFPRIANRPTSMCDLRAVKDDQAPGGRRMRPSSGNVVLRAWDVERGRWRSSEGLSRETLLGILGRRIPQERGAARKRAFHALGEREPNLARSVLLALPPTEVFPVANGIYARMLESAESEERVRLIAAFPRVQPAVATGSRPRRRGICR